MAELRGAPKAEEATTPELQNAREGYQAAISLVVYEGTTIWSKFSGMVYSHTILIAALVLILTSGKPDHTLLKASLAILGLILCFAWVFLTRRSFQYYRHWIDSARELETRHLSPVKTLAAGRTLAEGQAASTGQRWRFSPRVENLTYVIIGVFTVMYVLILFRRI